MAIDPRISLAAKTLDIGNTFTTALNNVRQSQANDAQQLANNQAQAIAPFQLQQAQRQNESAQVQQPANIRSALNDQQMKTLQGTLLFSQQALNQDPLVVAEKAQQAAAQAQKLGLDDQPFLEIADVAKNNPASLNQRLTETIQQGQQFLNGINNRQVKQQFGSQQTIKDEQGNLFFATQKKNPVTGQVDTVFSAVSGNNEQPQGKVNLVNDNGLTPQEKSKVDINKSKSIEQTKAKLQGKSAAIRAAVTKGSKIFDQIAPITKQISNYDDAINQLKNGANTGVVTSLLPSFKDASIKLDNVVKRLGLDVVGSTTFGALSEGELKFALDSAIPTSLKPEQLIEWLQAKKLAQQKVKERVEQVASFLSSGDHTIKDWVIFDKARQLNLQNNNNKTTQVNDIDLSKLSNEQLQELKNKQGNQ